MSDDSPGATKLVAAAMDGPFATEDAACEAMRRGSSGDTGTTCRVRAPEDDAVPARTGPSSFAQDAYIAEWPLGPDRACALVVRSADGWFIRPLDLCTVEGSGHDGQEVTGLTVEGGRLLVRLRETSGHPEEGLGARDELLACERGPLGRPACIAFFTAYEWHPPPAGEPSEADPSARVVQSVEFVGATDVRIGALSGDVARVPGSSTSSNVHAAGSYRLSFP